MIKKEKLVLQVLSILPILLFAALLKAQTITLQSSKTVKSKVYLYYLDILVDSKPPFVLQGNSSATISSNAPVFLFEADSMQNSFLAFPNDTLLVTKNKLGETIITCGDNKVRNNELKFFPTLTKKLGQVYGIKVTAKYLKAENSIISNALIDSDMHKRLAFLQSYAANNQVSPRFISLCNSYFTFLAILNKVYVAYTLYNRLSLQEKKAYKDTIITPALLNQFNCDSCIDNFQFYRGAAVFLNKLLQRESQNTPTELFYLWVLPKTQ